MSNWGPMFRLRLGISRVEMLDLSVPEMVDLIDFYKEMSQDG